MSTVYTKTPKGLRESTGKTRDLSGDLRDLLDACKGLFTVEDISAQASPSAKAWFAASIAKLVAEGYLRDVPEAMRKADAAVSDSDDLDSLDFSKPAPGAAKKAAEQARLEADKEKARHAAEEKARREADEKVRRELDEKARLEAEKRAKIEAEEKARRDAEEKIRREIEDKARREAEEKARLEAEERARREAEEKARLEETERIRREAEEKVLRELEEKARRERREKARLEEEERIRLEAEEKVRREIKEKARREAEEKARLEDEEKARLEEEERIRRKAEEKVRREIEEKARLEAEETARLEAEEKTRREAEEKARREAEEKARREAEEKARREAEEKARLEQEERDREAIRVRIRLRSEKRRRMILPLVIGLLLPVGVVMLLLQVLSFDGKRIEFEKAATEMFGVPVKVGSTRLGVLAGPQWLMNDVTVGADEQTVKIARVRLGMSLFGVFGAPLRFESIHLEAPQLPPVMALKLLGQAADGTRLKSGEIRVNGLTFDTNQKNLPALDIRATFDDGRLTKISGQGENPESGKLSLVINREDKWHLTLSAAQVRWLVGTSLPLADVTLKGDLAADGLQITEFTAALPSGELAGSGKLGWQDGWRVNAKLEGKRIDAAKLVPTWIQEGSISGSALMFAESGKLGDLFPHSKLSGSFSIGRGLLGGIDLDKVLQDRGQGEQSRFESLSGEFAVESGRIELSELKLTALELKATGSLSFDASRNANGRLAVEAKSGGVRRSANLRISGSLAAPRYQR